MYVCVCMYVYVCICMYVCVCMYVYVYVCMYVLYIYTVISPNRRIGHVLHLLNVLNLHFSFDVLSRWVDLSRSIPLPNPNSSWVYVLYQLVN